MVDEEHRDRFIELLEAVAAAGHPRVVATLRSDFYQRCVERPALARLMEDGQIPVAAPTDTLLEMITRPAVLAGLTLEEGLAGRLLLDTGSGAGALPLLAFVVDELYRLSDGQMTVQAYESLGGVQGAIGARAEHVFQQLGPAEQAVFDVVFRELVEIDDDGRPARRRAPAAAIEAVPEAMTLAEAFTDARLLVSGAGADGASLEVADEALFRSWPRLRDAIERQRDDLRLLRIVVRAAREWDTSGRADSHLWPHERLEPVYEMRERLQPALNDVTDAFVQPEWQRLLVELAAPTTPPHQRSATADRLAVIGPSAVPGLVPLLTSDEEQVRSAAHARWPGSDRPRSRPSPTWPPAPRNPSGAWRQSRCFATSATRARCEPCRRPRWTMTSACGPPRSALSAASAGTTRWKRWPAPSRTGRSTCGGRRPAASPRSATPRSRRCSRPSTDRRRKPRRLLGERCSPSARWPYPPLSRGSGASSPTKVRESAAGVLVRLGAVAASALADSPPGPSPDEEWRVVSVLGAIGDPVATERVAAALRSPDALVRAAAAGALHAIGDRGPSRRWCRCSTTRIVTCAISPQGRSPDWVRPPSILSSTCCRRSVRSMCCVVAASPWWASVERRCPASCTSWKRPTDRR